MPLQKGKIDILFRSGMAGDTDERVVPVGAFLDIKNAYVDKKGALSKRNGFQLVSVLKFDAARIDSARGLFSVGDELCIPGDRRLYARDDVSGKWNDRGTISPMMGSTERYFSESSKISAAHTDCSAADGYRAYVTSYLTSDITGIAGATAKVDVRIDSDDGNVTKQATLGTALTGSTLSTGTPATAAATGTTGTLQYDASYLYVCVATDTWKRVGITTW